MTLDYYLNLWQLRQPEVLAKTVTSDVYTVLWGGQKVVLKLLTPYGFEEAAGAAALRHFDGRGAVKLYQSDQNAHLLEYVEGGDLVDMVKAGQDEQATAISGDVLNQLHAVPVDSEPDGLTPLEVWFRELFNQAERYPRPAKVARKLLDDPREVRVLHGDIHHENIRFHAQRGWLAFDPKGLIGERTYDAANTLCNPVSLPALVHDRDRLLRNAAVMAQKINVELSRLLAFTYAYSALSAAWMRMDDADPWYPETITALLEPEVTL